MDFPRDPNFSLKIVALKTSSLILKRDFAAVCDMAHSKISRRLKELRDSMLYRRLLLYGQGANTLR